MLSPWTATRSWPACARARPTCVGGAWSAPPLFGSVARGEARPDSDIDVLVELDPEVVRTLFDDAGVKNAIGDLFETDVDVVDREGLKSEVRPGVMADAIYAF